MQLEMVDWEGLRAWDRRNARLLSCGHNVCNCHKPVLNNSHTFPWVNTQRVMLRMVRCFHTTNFQHIQSTLRTCIVLGQSSTLHIYIYIYILYIYTSMCIYIYMYININTVSKVFRAGYICSRFTQNSNQQRNLPYSFNQRRTDRKHTVHIS